MPKIQNIRMVQKSDTVALELSKRAKLPILPTVINWLKIKMYSIRTYSPITAWNASYEILKFLHSAKGKNIRLEVKIVSTNFKIVNKIVHAAMINYSDWLILQRKMNIAQGVNSYRFSLELLDNRSIGAVIKGEQDEVAAIGQSYVTLKKACPDEIQDESADNFWENTVIVEEYFFVYVKDIRIFGMVKVEHMEHGGNMNAQVGKEAKEVKVVFYK